MKKITLPTLIFASFNQIAFAADGSLRVMNWIYNNIVIILSLVIIIAVLVTFFRLLMNTLSANNLSESAEEDLDFDDDTWIERMYKKAWDLVPVQEESQIDMGHNYDGIRELDNKLPPWWVALFYGTIVFGVVYMYIYEWSGDWSSTQEWEEEMEIGERKKREYLTKMANLVNEETVTLLTDEASIAEGQKVFSTLCIACHGAAGEGNSIGPNLTDEYWLHGGGVKNVFNTIKYGVPEKGMISWKDQLKPGTMQKVASFIVSLEGTNPPNGKEPQGTIWEGEEE